MTKKHDKMIQAMLHTDKLKAADAIAKVLNMPKKWQVPVTIKYDVSAKCGEHLLTEKFESDQLLILEEPNVDQNGEDISIFGTVQIEAIGMHGARAWHRDDAIVLNRIYKAGFELLKQHFDEYVQKVTKDIVTHTNPNLKLPKWSYELEVEATEDTYCILELHADMTWD